MFDVGFGFAELYQDRSQRLPAARVRRTKLECSGQIRSRLLPLALSRVQLTSGLKQEGPGTAAYLGIGKV